MGFFTRESVRSTTLVRGNEKFADLAAALKRRGLPFRPDLQYCKAFLTTNSGDVDTVVDNMEEKHFLFTRTEYPRLSGDNFDADRSQCIPDSCETYTEMEGDWKEIKANLCVEYLRENKGLTLPQKWESCRLRFEEVISRGDDPKLEALYIYLGKDASVEAETE
ncbi:hypothetical protein PI124_g12324 [Phytophthora idaei]|nr:hypothetical protein PI125_g15767 [Phytophthora idaei]KAG3143239.1 hypothetical protein PI126_g14720 [Phytophthora idaei]KAG3242851.1 hypothetical protein PI124_g12324 [Phytophthora idaei]